MLYFLLDNMEYQLVMRKSYGKHVIPCLLFGVFISSAATAATKILRLERLDNPNAIYTAGVLRLALSYSQNKYVFEDVVDSTSQIRSIQNLNSGLADVLCIGTSDVLEKKLRPVRIPLYRGLLGHRVFMIRKGTQHLFDDIDSLEDLKKISLGQGSEWPDTTILEANGLNVVKVLRYNSLFPMLDGGRFDAFPRGVQEPWPEMESRPELNLTVENNLVLVYRMPYYFFVGKDNYELHREIESGLEQAIKDGKFDEYFFNSPHIKAMLEKANLKNRKAFYLDNPMLTPETPLHREELWLDREQL